MSRGCWDYIDERLCEDIFGYSSGYMNSPPIKPIPTKVREENRLGDAFLSEIAYDVFCMLYACDSYKCGDIGEDTYRKQLKVFKDKWVNHRNSKNINRVLSEYVERFKRDIYDYFGDVKEDVRKD